MGEVRAATSYDVAQRAGVSRATVSHVLNGQLRRFTPETIERVHRAAAELGYVPSAAGRTLARGRSDFAVVVLPNTTFFNLQEILDPIGEQMATRGLSVVLRFWQADPRPLRHLVETLRPTVVIDLGALSAGEAADLRRAGCPVFSPTDPAGGPPPSGSVGHLQVDVLREAGFDRIAYAYLRDERDDPYGADRSAGVRARCAETGLAEPIDIDIHLDLAGDTQALRAAWRGGPRLGVACYNDEVAIAILAGARELGLAVPDRVGAVGVDASRTGQLVAPRLTTIRIDLRAAAAAFARRIARLLGDPAQEPAGGASPLYTVLPGDST